ncbi:MAG: M16 family metallopeptidase [Armatimonadota bacterium]
MNRSGIWGGVLIGAIMLTAGGRGNANTSAIRQRTLANGLEVLVQEDHSAPLFSSYIWYRVGVRNEPKGQSGISHFLEHMAFKGTEHMSSREMNRLVTEKGGYLNGFTSMDYTAYVETLPPDSLELAFDIESERMARCTLSAEDIESEKGVVISEFEGRENDPAFLLRVKMMAEQFPGQPYGREIIGTKEDLRALTREKVLAYYRNHYAPNNAVLVVVGDVNADEVFAKAEKYFGPIPPDTPAPPEPNPGRGATGEKRFTLELPGRTPYIQVMYGVPPIQHPDHIALEVIQNILSGGRTSRLYPALVASGLASGAGGWDYENPQPTVFAFQVSMLPGAEHEKVQQVLDGVIERLREEPVSESELTKAKNQTKASFVYSSDGVTQLAQQIGYYHVIDSYRYLETFPAKVDAITAADIQRVMRTYFVKENRTVGWLIPTGEGQAEGGGMEAGPTVAQWQPAAQPAFGSASSEPVPPPAGLGTVTPIYQTKLDNGMTVVMQENHSAPFVAIYGNIVAGPVLDPEGKAGLAAFCAEMLSRGTQARPWQAIRQELETVAAELYFGTGVQVGTLSGRCLTDNLPLLLGDAAEQLMTPSFPADEVERVRAEVLAAQQRRDEDTMQVAEKELLSRLYPPGHPLHSPRLGTSETVAGISRDDLVGFHARYYRPENTYLAVVGDIDPAKVGDLVEKVFGSWQRSGEPLRPEIPQVPVPTEPQTVEVPVPNKTQTDIVLGFPGISRRDPRYYQADLMNYVLGQSFMSRLNMRIREELGLAYDVGSYFFAYWGPGPWVLQMGVAPENAERAIAAALEELKRMQQDPPSAGELQLWKDYVKGTVARRMETYGGIAQELTLASFYDLGLYHAYRYPGILAGITADEVNAAAKQFLHPDGYIAVMAGPVGEAAEQK